MYIDLINKHLYAILGSSIEKKNLTKVNQLL